VAPKASEAKKMIGVPVSIVTPVDLSRLIRELEVLDEQLHQAGLRHTEVVDMPHTSRFLGQTLEFNKVNLLDAAERKLLMQFLVGIKAKAPVLHMSFSADPAPAFLEKLTTWLRREIHPLVLVTVGMQPNIGAGCIVRSTNKYFDLSLRQAFTDKKLLLQEAMAIKMAPPKQEASPAPGASANVQAQQVAA